MAVPVSLFPLVLPILQSPNLPTINPLSDLSVIDPLIYARLVFQYLGVLMEISSFLFLVIVIQDINSAKCSN